MMLNLHQVTNEEIVEPTELEHIDDLVQTYKTTD